MQKFGLQTYTVKNDRDSRIAHAIIQQLIIEIIHFDWTNGKLTIYIQGGPEKTAQTLMRYNFSTAGHIESRGFQQNVQKQTGNTKKNSVRLLQLTILC